MLFGFTSIGPSTARDTIGSLGNYLGGDAWYNMLQLEMTLIIFLILIIMHQKVLVV